MTSKHGFVGPSLSVKRLTKHLSLCQGLCIAERGESPFCRNVNKTRPIGLLWVLVKFGGPRPTLCIINAGAGSGGYSQQWGSILCGWVKSGEFI